MPVHHIYDETAGNAAYVAAMADRRPFWRSALLGAYVELTSVAGRAAYAAVKAGVADQHEDGVVSYGDLVAIEPLATDCLVAGLLRYGLIVYVGSNDFRLVQHPGLIHSKTARQLAHEARNKKDTTDKSLTVPVRARDGDQCRVCRVVVKWSTTKTDPNGGTFDHIDPRAEALAADDLAVCCRRCNGLRSNREDANEFAPHQAPPERPYYTKSTAAYLNKEGCRTDAGHALRPTGQKWLLPRIEIRVRPLRSRDTAPPSDPAPSRTPLQPLPQWAWEGPEGHEGHDCGQRPGTQPDTASNTQRPGAQPDTASNTQRLASQANPAPAPNPTSGEAARTPETAEQLVPNSTETRQANYPNSIPDSRSKAPPKTGGLPGGEGKGRVLEGSGGGVGEGPRRRRGRRGKPSPFSIPQPQESP